MTAGSTPSPSRLERALAAIERVGNRLPDPAVLFLLLLAITWVASALLAQIEFDAIDPRSGKPLAVLNLLSGTALTQFTSDLVTTFTSFHPLGGVIFYAAGRHPPAERRGPKAALAAMALGLLLIVLTAWPAGSAWRSATGVLTATDAPLMPYFALVVVFCQKCQKSAGIGTLLALMLPYSVAFLATWSALLVVYLALGLPLGVGG